MGLMNGLMGNATQIHPGQAAQEYGGLLGQEEPVLAAYQLVRDAMLFTDRRLILIDKQGITGKKVEYHSLPYKSISHFSVETAGHFDLDAELRLSCPATRSPSSGNSARASTSTLSRRSSRSW